MILCLFRSAFTSQALFGFFCGSFLVKARFLRQHSATDLNSYNENSIKINWQVPVSYAVSSDQQAICRAAMAYFFVSSREL
jgi:hypothetical protein